MREGKRVCAIDIGSNSVRSLCADRAPGGELARVYCRRETTRLIAGMQDGRLQEKAIDGTAEAICTFAQEAREAGCEIIYCFGTAAMRRAKNAQEVAARVLARTGLAIDIVSGEQEALLAYLGVGREGGVIDIGGGSTEIIIGEKRAIRMAKSLPFGAVTLRDREGAGESREALRAELRAAAKACDLPRCGKYSGIGGTITTAAAISAAMEVYDPERISRIVLSRGEIAEMLARLSAMELAERRRVPGLEPGRADIIVYGLLILEALMETLGIAAIAASDSDNLMGYLRWKQEN